MEKSETINQLATALSIAQGKFEAIKRTEKVDFTSEKGRRKYNYAPLEEVVNACRKSLSENGLSILQLTSCITDGMFVLETVLIHKSGEWIKSEMNVTAYPANPQQQGSALTYARRYSLSALLGVASEEDDDGEAGIKKEDETPQTTQKVEKQPEPTRKEHYCELHGVNFFMKGKMKSYGHPIKDANGKDTGEWCHEHKEPPQAKTQADRDIEALYEGESTEPIPEKQPEPPQDGVTSATKPVGEQDKAETRKEPIDLTWLHENLKAVKWGEGTCISWLKSKINYQGLDFTGRLDDIVRRMDAKQAEFLTKEIQSRLEMA